MGQMEPTAGACIIDAADALREGRLGGSMTQSEYKDLRVPLNVSGKARAGPAISKDAALRKAAINASPQATRILSEVLRIEAAAGWQPDGAADLPGLLLAGRV